MSAPDDPHPASRAAVSHVPSGRSALCPFLVVKDAVGTIAFAKAVFAAREIAPPLFRSDGRLWNAELEIGGVTVMLGEAGDGFERPGFLYVYVEDADAAYAAALDAGAKPIMPLEARFYGARDGGVEDPAGNLWWIGTQRETLTPEEIKARAAVEETRRDR